MGPGTRRTESVREGVEEGLPDRGREGKECCRRVPWKDVGACWGGFGWWVLVVARSGCRGGFEQMMGNLAGFDGSRSRLQRLFGTAVECAYLFWTRGLETCFWTALARMLDWDRCKDFVN